MPGRGWKLRREKLQPCRAIAIGFRGSEIIAVQHLTAHEATRDPVDKNAIHGRIWIPSEPPGEAEFRTWVAQCVNQAAGALCKQIAADIEQVGKTGTMMFTDSKLVSDLLDVHLTEKGRLREDLANLALRFELPFFDDLSIADVMAIRQAEGEAFENYRLELQRHLRQLRAVDSNTELRRRLEEVQHEMAEVQVRHVSNEMGRLKRKHFRNAVMGVASVATVIPTHGLSVAGLLMVADATKRVFDERDTVRQHPAYFTWRLKRKTGQA